MAIDKEYINYNLSLIDPNDLDIPEVPADPKVNINVTIPLDFDQKEDVIDETYVPPLNIKEGQDITTYVELEQKETENTESDLDIGNDASQILLAREFPIVGIETEFMTTQLRNQTWDSTVRGKSIPSDQPYSSTDRIAIKDDNLGKIPITTPDEDVRQTDPNFNVRVLDQEYEKEKSSGKEPSQYNIVNLSQLESGKDDSEDIMNFSKINLSKIAKTPYTGREISYDDVVNKINIKSQISNLGALHVYPVNPNKEGGISAKYTIPFMFNAKVTSSGISAKFEASTLLSRIGDIQSYIKTDTAQVNITTRYQVLSASKTENAAIPNGFKGEHAGTGAWMEDFTLSNIQKIEMAYRGLVYPQTSKKEASFFRPPVVKIVFGNANKILNGQMFDKTVPFNNLLTYPYIMAQGTKIYHKSFIVTKVDIKKDWDMSPLILNDDNDGIIDLQAFDINMSLVEIDPMYIGVLPSFEDFYSIVPTLSRI
ncbi:MAG: hypothetical protein ACTSWD_08110 [Candidatus Heimdallarchaeota archaeon]|nr:MAG: hypothetical protein DRJ01_02190 [Bacteroidota bacterium]